MALFSGCQARTLRKRSRAQSSSSLVMHSGGASRIVWACVSLHSNPSCMSCSQYFRATPASLWNSIPIHNPRARISLTLLVLNARSCSAR